MPLKCISVLIACSVLGTHLVPSSIDGMLEVCGFFTPPAFPAIANVSISVLSLKIFSTKKKARNPQITDHFSSKYFGPSDIISWNQYR